MGLTHDARRWVRSGGVGGEGGPKIRGQIGSCSRTKGLGLLIAVLVVHHARQDTVQDTCRGITVSIDPCRCRPHSA